MLVLITEWYIPEIISREPVINVVVILLMFSGIAIIKNHLTYFSLILY